MAIFSDVSEVERTSGFTKPFEKTTGIKKYGLAMLGYNADGTKNTFGKYFGHGNVLLDHYVPKALAEGDSKEVIDANEASSWGAQIGSAKVALNFVGGGAASSMFGQMGKQGVRSGLDSAQSGVQGGDAKNGIMNGVTNVAGSALVNEAYKRDGRDKANETLNSRVSGFDNVDKVDTDISEYSTAEDFNAAKNAGNISGDAQMTSTGREITDTSSITKGTEGTNVMGKVGAGMSIIGDIAETYQYKLQAAEDSKRAKKKILKKSVLSPGPQNYL